MKLKVSFSIAKWSDIGKICFVLFDKLLPLWRYFDNANLMETFVPIGKKTRTVDFHKLFLKLLLPDS